MRVAETGIARRHRMAIGTISSDAEMQVKWANGSRLGSVEESFISRLKPGDDFGFAGRVLRLIQVKDMTAYVRASKAKRTQVPRWQGGRLPLSVELADAVLMCWAMRTPGARIPSFAPSHRCSTSRRSGQRCLRRRRSSSRRCGVGRVSSVRLPLLRAPRERRNCNARRGSLGARERRRRSRSTRTTTASNCCHPRKSRSTRHCSKQRCRLTILPKICSQA